MLPLRPALLLPAGPLARVVALVLIGEVEVLRQHIPGDPFSRCYLCWQAGSLAMASGGTERAGAHRDGGRLHLQGLLEWPLGGMLQGREAAYQCHVSCCRH